MISTSMKLLKPGSGIAPAIPDAIAILKALLDSTLSFSKMTFLVRDDSRGKSRVPTPGRSYKTKFSFLGCGYACTSIVVSVVPTAAAPGAFGSNPRKVLMKLDFPTPEFPVTAMRTATSIPSERVFSTAGDIVTAQRSCLASDLVDRLLFCKENCQKCDLVTKA
ncbi:hypothetical protein MAR_003222 [Mya arenaria]|uniref:HAT C-terminal dimerisation domain-containing protein n=1 Tax=Mya arenaria TaxID=6604 RepID=A0ABY7G7Y4_MYAAR|nr:hypothetical protein MAR_003222 [Mya arenaria]